MHMLKLNDKLWLTAVLCVLKSKAKLKLLIFLHITSFNRWLTRPVSSVVKNIDVGSGDLGFDYRVAQIGHSVANGLPPLRRFFGAV